jgi:hypothetical protein
LFKQFNQQHILDPDERLRILFLKYNYGMLPLCGNGRIWSGAVMRELYELENEER